MNLKTKTMKIEIKELNFPSYEDLDSSGYFTTEGIFKINNFEVVSEVIFCYDYSEQYGDRFTPPVKEAFIQYVTIDDNRFYDLENNPIEFMSKKEEQIIELIEKEILKQTETRL